MAIFLDTGFIMALKSSDDKNHTISKKWMQRFLKGEFGQIYTSTFVFDELVTLALVRLKNNELAIDIGNYILNSPRIIMVNLTKEDFHDAWGEFQHFIVKNLSFTDCTNLVFCKRLKCELMATFDQHFAGLIGII